ncbi:MAG TPA: sucrase ferredoxin [Acidimicrobiales bacterium]|nr:sucrase ferredoxin [Acidimicrobiales bacterium]
MAEVVQCASESAADDEPLFGTASVVGSWLLLEQPTTWPSDAVGQSGLPPQVVRHLEVGSRRTGVRVLLLRRPGATTGAELPRRNLFLVHSRGRAPWIEHRLLDDVAEVTDVDLASLAAGERQPGGWSQPWTGPLHLVCTHSRHDPCCGRLGRPLARVLGELDEVGDRVWESSHFGGERFAGNLVCFPHGLYFGRVDPQVGAEVVAAYQRGEIDLDHYRGRAGDPFVVQAAEYHLRRALGLAGIEDVAVVERRTGEGGVVEVVLTTPDGTFAVRVAVGSGPSARMLTCTADHAALPPSYTLEGIERV